MERYQHRAGSPDTSPSVDESLLVGAAAGGERLAPPTFVYAIGRITPRFPTLALEKEFAQVSGRRQTTGMTDQQVLQSVLAARENRYLARQICWVFTIEGLDTYLLMPRDPTEVDLLIDALSADARGIDVDVVIGILGPIAPADVCNGLMLPIVAFDQIYSFDRDSLLQAIPRPESIEEKEDSQFRRAAGELFDRILQMADNAGATDEQRALNYLAVRYDPIYAKTTEMHNEDATLATVEVRQSRLAGVRKIVDVIFTFTNRTTDVAEKWFVRVDVTEEFPFMFTRLSPFVER